MEDVLIFWLDRFLARKTPYLRRCAVIDLLDSGVESANTAKPRGNRHLSHGESCLIEKPLCKVQAARLRNRARRGAQVAEKQAAEMARTQSHMFCQSFYTPVFQTSFVDQLQRSGNRVSRAGPRGCARRAFRPTAQAGAKASFGGRSGGREIPDIAFQGR